ncbi:hypothetical protein L6V77_28410 [Myxococcota bacterium]|nr:hypothetical protein [Myxococcota bacterium]
MNGHPSPGHPVVVSEHRVLFVFSVVLAVVSLVMAALAFVVYFEARADRTANTAEKARACDPGSTKGDGPRG